jgi:methyltransferase (TIGR00027 family)
VRVFEVDHPATQVWKRERLSAASIEPPPSLTFAPIDFERQTLADGLAAAGFALGQQTFFTWLGVVPYLTESAVWSTLGYIASVSEAHVVFDYSDPPHTLSAPMRSAHDARAARVAAIGETWLSYFDADSLHERLLALGYREIEDLGPREIAGKYFPVAVARAPERGGHIIRATTLR